MVAPRGRARRGAQVTALFLLFAGLSQAARADDLEFFLGDLGDPGGTIAGGHWIGDMNCDRIVNFADIDPFVLTLTDPDQYQVQYPDCDILEADLDCNGVINFDDITAWINLIFCMECGPGPWWCGN